MTNRLKFVVCGGLGYTDRETAFRTLDELNRRIGIALVIHGGARGADALGGAWASERGIPVRSFRGGRPPGRRRNRRWKAGAGSRRANPRKAG